MGIVRVDELEPGQVLSRALVDEEGRILLNGGVELTAKYIDLLTAKGYTKLYVQDPELPFAPEPEDDLRPETRAKAISVMHRWFGEVRKEIGRVGVDTYRDVKAACGSGSIADLVSLDGPIRFVQDAVKQILNEILERDVLSSVSLIKSADTEIYDHSLDVCVLSILIGRSVGLQGVRLRQLASGALLHDMGMVFMDESLDERTWIVQHAELGYELLRNTEDPDLLAPHVAYEHHERQDGEGLPRGLRGGNTIARQRDLPPPVPTLIGEIAAVANTYSVLATGMRGSEALPPDVAVRQVCAMAGPALNREVVAAFLRVVPVFPVGTVVVVSGAPYANFTGIVAEVHGGALDKPTVILIRDNRNTRIEPVQIDMRDEPALSLRCKRL
ncbi:MAG: HD domain-containing protein [bacterium]|nr:HD domain-containing protein [bacterium]